MFHLFLTVIRNCVPCWVEKLSKHLARFRNLPLIRHIWGRQTVARRVDLEGDSRRDVQKRRAREVTPIDLIAS